MRKKFENGSKFITKKKKKIDIGKIAADAMKKGVTSKYITRKDKKKSPQYITKKQKPFITKKTPEQIREREMVKKASGGRIGLKAGSRGCKLAKRGRGRAYGKNS